MTRPDEIEYPLLDEMGPFTKHPALGITSTHTAGFHYRVSALTFKLLKNFLSISRG